MKSSEQRDEQILQKQLADYARFPEMNPGPVFRLDLDGKIILANKAARELFRDKNLLGSNWLNVCPDYTSEMWKQVLETRESLSFETNVKERCILFNYLLPEERDFVFAYGTDITDRKIAERLLKEVARFPDMNPGPVLRFDFQGNILLANSAAHEVFGIDLEGKCWRDFCPILEDDNVWKSIQEATAKPFHIEIHIGEKDFMFAHRSDLENNLLFAFGADITQNKRTERLLIHNEKMATLGTLAAGIAHELNNPAAAISRTSEYLSETYSDLETLNLELNKIEFSDRGLDELQKIKQSARQYALQPEHLDAMSRSNKEIEIDNWFNNHNMDNVWDLAPSLVDQKYDTETLNKYYSIFKNSGFLTVIKWSVCIYSIHSLINEINQSSGHISKIVSVLDQDTSNPS